MVASTEVVDCRSVKPLTIAMPSTPTPTADPRR